MSKRQFAFGKINFILLGISMAIVILGFVLMSGPGSTEDVFNPEIFSPMRIKVAPVICLIGFLMMIAGILYRARDERETEPVEEQTADDASANL